MLSIWTLTIATAVLFMPVDASQSVLQASRHSLNEGQSSYMRFPCACMGEFASEWATCDAILAILTFGAAEEAFPVLIRGREQGAMYVSQMLYHMHH